MLVVDINYPYLSKEKGVFRLSSLYSTDSVTINLPDEIEIGNTYIAGDFISVNKVTVVGERFQANKIDIAADATFKADVNSGVVMIKGNAIFEKYLNCTEFQVEKKVSVKKRLACRGHATIGGDLIARDTLVVCGKLIVNGQLWVGRNLDARAGIRIGGEMRIFGGETLSYGRVSLGDVVLIATDNHIFGYTFSGKMPAPSPIEEFVCDESATFFTTNKASLKNMATVALMARTNVKNIV